MASPGGSLGFVSGLVIASRPFLFVVQHVLGRHIILDSLSSLVRVSVSGELCGQCSIAQQWVSYIRSHELCFGYNTDF